MDVPTAQSGFMDVPTAPITSGEFRAHAGAKLEQPLAISMNLPRKGYSTGVVISGKLTILFG